MKEELKKSLRTYGALLLLGVTGVPLGAAVGLIEALFCEVNPIPSAFESHGCSRGTSFLVSAVSRYGRSCDRGSQSEIRWQGKRRHESDF